MKITIKQTGDLPDLGKVLSKVQSKDLMQAIGTQIASIAQRAFGEESLRAASWPARKADYPHGILRKSGELWRSLRVISAEAGRVSVGTHVVYAAIHQFGGTTKPHVIVARNAKALAFTGTFKFFGIASSARKTFAKKVNHPGSRIPARPFFPIRPGTSQLTDYAEKAIGSTIRKYLGKGPA